MVSTRPSTAKSCLPPASSPILAPCSRSASFSRPSPFGLSSLPPSLLLFSSPHREAMYTTLLMSTGLTFGTISALFGLSHGIIDQAQYTVVVAGVVASAVVPTLIANAFFLPHHLLPPEERDPAER